MLTMFQKLFGIFKSHQFHIGATGQAITLADAKNIKEVINLKGSLPHMKTTCVELSKLAEEKNITLNMLSEYPKDKRE